MAMQLAHAEQLMHKIVTNLFTVLSVAGDSKLTGRTWWGLSGKRDWMSKWLDEQELRKHLNKIWFEQELKWL